MPTEPGALKFKLQTRELAQVSPSRYEAMVSCALREVWGAGESSTLLPGAPAARMGSVIHKLLEAANRGEFLNADKDAIENRWLELVAAAEFAMRRSWLERHLVPLRESVPSYEVSRLRAVRQAIEISKTSSREMHREASSDSARTGTEMRVSSQDGLVAGRIDRVIHRPTDAVLVDYKSGTILSPGNDGNNGPVKPGYEIQMRLYAALYRETFGVWPEALELVSLTGVRYAVSYTPELSFQLLADACTRLKRINAIIESSRTGDRSPDADLARPHQDTCRFCQFRPGCEPYRKALRSAGEADIWPDDVFGTLHKLTRLGNSRIVLEIVPENPSADRVFIRGLDSHEDRHPALRSLQVGDHVGAFNLRRQAVPNLYEEGTLTTLYKLMAL